MYSFLLFGFIAVVLTVTYLYLKNAPLIVDEVDGYQQVLNFVEGNNKLEKISAMPTYYYLLAMVAKITGITSIAFIRTITVVISLLTLFAFFITSRKIAEHGGEIKTLLLLFMPTLFVFYFLIYTEVLSLLFILLMVYFGVQKKHVLAGMFGIFSMCIRQNNVMWVAFMMMYGYIAENGFSISVTLVKNYAIRALTYITGFVLFAVFVVINGGVAVGDKSMHPGNVSIGNIVFFLFVFFILFLPQHIYSFKKVIKILTEKKWMVAIAVTLFALFYFLFKNNHPYNQISPHYFMRNKLLIYITSAPWIKAMFVLTAVYALLSLCVTPLQGPYQWLFYAFAILFLLPSWLIDVRYYVIPFTLFILFKKQENKYVDYITIIYFIAMSGWVIKMTRTSTCFV